MSDVANIDLIHSVRLKAEKLPGQYKILIGTV